MKTTLRRLFNYWLPPGHSSDKETPNPLVEVAVKRLTEEMGGYDS